MVLFGMAITFSKSPSIAAETRLESSMQHFGGSVWVMGEWSVSQWIMGVISFQKIFGLYGLKHHIVEMSPMRDGTDDK